MKAAECEGKRKFKSRSEAKRVLREMGRQHVGSKEHHVYECKYCHGFHIGERWLDF